MQEAIIWLVTYEGQTESPYKWACNSFYEGHELLMELMREYPERTWTLEEKDVS